MVRSYVPCVSSKAFVLGGMVVVVMTIGGLLGRRTGGGRDGGGWVRSTWFYPNGRSDIGGDLHVLGDGLENKNPLL